MKTIHWVPFVERDLLTLKSNPIQNSTQLIQSKQDSRCIRATPTYWGGGHSPVCILLPALWICATGLSVGLTSRASDHGNQDSASSGLPLQLSSQVTEGTRKDWLVPLNRYSWFLGWSNVNQQQTCLAPSRLNPLPGHEHDSALQVPDLTTQLPHALAKSAAGSFDLHLPVLQLHLTAIVCAGAA